MVATFQSQWIKRSTLKYPAEFQKLLFVIPVLTKSFDNLASFQRISVVFTDVKQMNRKGKETNSCHSTGKARSCQLAGQLIQDPAYIQMWWRNDLQMEARWVLSGQLGQHKLWYSSHRVALQMPSYWRKYKYNNIVPIGLLFTQCQERLDYGMNLFIWKGSQIRPA